MLEQASAPAQVAGGGRLVFGEATDTVLVRMGDILGELRLPRSMPTTPSVRDPRGTGQALFVLGLAAGLLGALAVERAARLFLDRDIELVRAVRDMTLEEFVGEVDSAELVDDALTGMLEGLDDYSHYYGPREIPELERETSGEFLGIGVVFRKDEVGQILFPYPDSPADRAGLKVGDRIVTAAGAAVSAMETSDLQSLLHEEEEVRLAVEGLEGVRRDVVLQPDVVLDPTVRHTRMLDAERGIGYLSIRSFSHRTPEEFDRAVEELRARGLRGLVLDLRANPGGILDAAVAIANRFVPAGTLVATRTRSETLVTEADPERATLAGLALVVLVDRRSASASEVLAAALQDHAVAALIGEPTWGKGTVQTLKRIGDERAVVKITTAHYCSPSLRTIEHTDDAEHSGIAPDLWVALPTEEQREIHRFLSTYSPPEAALAALRAWEEREHVELIEPPPSDKQLNAALALLTGKELELRGDPLP